jgi:hypothetical protein
MRWAGNVARTGEMRNTSNILVRETEGKRSLGETRRKWEDNIKVYLREIRSEGVYWINLNQGGTLVDTVMNL